MGISIQNVSKRFGDFVAVDGVSFDVETGELVALLGPSGCGKSTLLRVIAGLENPDTGAVYFNGINMNDMSARQRRVGFVFQHYALFKHMTAEQNIAFSLNVQKKNKREIADRVNTLIDLVKMRGYAGHYPSQLSGGQRQRVALARALAAEPAILLLDEPFAALDLKVRESLVGWLRNMHDKLNVTSIFVTHDQNEAMEISDKIIVINKGRVEQIGAARDVYEEPTNKFVASFIGNINIIDAHIEGDVIYVHGTQVRLHKPADYAARSGDIVLLVRPEDIGLRPEAGGPHSIPAVVTAIRYKGSVTEVDLQLASFGLTALEFSKYIWQVGEQVFLNIKKYNVFAAGDSHHAIRRQLEQLGYIE
jgi:sulfate transport system ATP-binding protein